MQVRRKDRLADMHIIDIIISTFKVIEDVLPTYLMRPVEFVRGYLYLKSLPCVEPTFYGFGESWVIYPTLVGTRASGLVFKAP